MSVLPADWAVVPPGSRIGRYFPPSRPIPICSERKSIRSTPTDAAWHRQQGQIPLGAVSGQSVKEEWIGGVLGKHTSNNDDTSFL